MKPFYQDNHNTLYCLDFRKNELPDECVQCVVTSPPYWGLRKYSGEQELIWGGDENCEHRWVDKNISAYKSEGGVHWQRAKAIEAGTGKNHGSIPDAYEQWADRKKGFATVGFCSLCGAWKGAYGLEPTPEMYVQHTVEILREIRRVLRKDGVVFWNIGDSYAGSGGANENKERGGVVENPNRKPQSAITGMEPVTWTENGKPKKKGMTRVGGVKGLKPKDLCLIPFRVAIAAQEDSWWVRSVIIWSKPNPMPESVTDRPTESHEYILMLTKSARYYWDQDAVREPDSGKSSGNKERKSNKLPEGHPSHFAVNVPWESTGRGRNIRSVWTFPTKPGPSGAVRNFAVFPEKLPELCIKAATPEVGCCNKCGAPWVRMIKTQVRYRRQKSETEKYPIKPIDGYPGIDRRFDHEYKADRQTTGWRPTCNCNADKVPSLVVDPFMGAGTTLLVAKKLNRRATGYDTATEYCELTVKRLEQQVML